MKAFFAVLGLIASATAQADIYAGCGDAWQCAGVKAEGAACVDTADCVMLAKWMPEGTDSTSFELYSQHEGALTNNGWIALGFSEDPLMGRDTVIMNRQAYGSELWWNTEVLLPLPVGSTGEYGVVGDAVIEGDNMVARFTIPNVLEFTTPSAGEAITNDLSVPSYLLFAGGVLLGSDAPDFHQFNWPSQDVVTIAP